MNERIDIIKKIIEKKNAKSYLEIGVWKGTCFLNIDAPIKIAVDPKLLIPKKERSKHHCFDMKSDKFFKKKSKFLKKMGLDVVFIDGLHTYQQAISDFNNSFQYLNEDGVIIMHDCNPPYSAAAIPLEDLHKKVNNKEEIPGWTGDWSGDVWKAIVHLRITRNDLEIFVLDIDWGVAVIKRGSPKANLNLSLASLNALSYEDLEKNRSDLLNLKDFSYFEKFLLNL